MFLKTGTLTMPIDFKIYVHSKQKPETSVWGKNNTKLLHWKKFWSRRIPLTSSQIIIYTFVSYVESSAQCHQCVHFPHFSKFSSQCLPLWSAPRWLPHYWDEFLHNSERKCTEQVSSDFFLWMTLHLDGTVAMLIPLTFWHPNFFNFFSTPCM
jgi:hypothetical protein